MMDEEDPCIENPWQVESEPLHGEPNDIQSDSLTIKEEINEDDNMVLMEEDENPIVPMCSQVPVPSTNVEDEDYPVVISSELPREKLFEMCCEYQILTWPKLATDKMRSKIQTHLKKCHPIHNHISSLSAPQLKLLQAKLRLKSREIPGSIAPHYFIHHSKTPLRKLLEDLKKINLRSEQKLLPRRLIQEVDQLRKILPGCDQAQCEESSNAPNVKTEKGKTFTLMNEKLVATEELEENQMDAGETMDPLDVLPEEDMTDVLLDSSNLTDKDCSILTIPSHLSEVELKQLCLKHFDDQFYQENKVSVIEKKLQSKLKMNHPIFSYLFTL